MKAFKTCYKCKEIKHISKFYPKENMCKDCRLSIAKIHKIVKDKLNYHKENIHICEICNEIFDKLELASINGHKYTLDTNDYILLCSGCHYLFDNLKLTRYKP